MKLIKILMKQLFNETIYILIYKHELTKSNHFLFFFNFGEKTK